MTTKTKAPRNTVENTPTPEGIEIMAKLISDFATPVEAPNNDSEAGLTDSGPITQSQMDAVAAAYSTPTPTAAPLSDAELDAMTREEVRALPREVKTATILAQKAAALAIVSDWTPPANARKGKSERYPFSLLEVGQSFMVPDRTAANFYGTAYSASTRLRVKLSVHDVEGGVMVHRSA
jgi:hypothetical protein